MSKYLAEFVGTFVLVFGGCGAAVLAGDKIGFLGVSFAFGLSLLAMAYTIGHISGCHINPAVTLGLFITNKMDRRNLVGYWVAQILGAIVAAACLLAIAKGTPNGYDPAALGFAANGYGAHSPGHYGLAAAALTEIVLTFFLVLTVIGSTDIKAPVGFAGLPIGLVLVLIHLVGIPVTNTSVNPARSIGPAIFVGLSSHWRGSGRCRLPGRCCADTDCQRGRGRASHSGARASEEPSRGSITGSGAS
jgi:aquaporin Z